ncbi:MAG: endonuclease MutS2 [Eubacteriales bacterium]|nr:endonuclease MutS2 [Eubacteriales bacterium]
MNEHILTTLEYDKIRDICATHTASELGRELMRSVRPASNLDSAARLLEQTWEADSIYRRFGKSPVDSFTDIRDTLERIHAALFLTMPELLSVASCLKASRKAKDILKNGNEDDLLTEMAGRLSDHFQIEDEIQRCIISEDEMADNASVELSRIRRQMHIVSDRVKDKLNSIIKNQSMQKYLQDPIITMRNGRYAIPVKAEYRGQVNGLIHDQSGSGQTVYIEPSAVVELGNEYKKLLLDEKKEMERILSGLTALVDPFASELHNSIMILGELDVIFAKAIMARDMRATRPTLNEQGRIRIQNGRHPLLDRNKVVPMSIHLGEEYDTLIITGPNTGGKTVTLKTVGLFCLMAASGMFIPADEGSAVAIFDQVYADIGDEQSIEQSLSTFSSHMVNLVSILKESNTNTLVLLDELGAGTDPVEGAALAQAILEHLQAAGVKTMATTHYSEIKAFALTREGMQNASMEFDVDNLCPTYKLYIGIPGKSNAFEISKRLGLSDDVIDRAREYLKGEEVAFEDVLRGAEEQRRRAEEYSQQMKLENEAANRLRNELEQESKKLADQKKQLREKAKEDAQKIVKETRHEMDSLIAQLRELKNIDSRELERVIQKSKDAMRKREDELYATVEKEQIEGEPPKNVKVGESVYVISIRGDANVLTMPDQKGMVQVQAGIMKLSVPLSDIRHKTGDTKLKKKPQAREILTNVREMKLELDLRGMLVDDAILEIDRYIDDCALTGRKEFYCIHGKGTGALRMGVQRYLKHHSKVQSFRDGAYGEGDAGVTVVTLK